MNKLTSKYLLGLALFAAICSSFASPSVCPSVNEVKAVKFYFAFNENGHWSFGSERLYFKNVPWIVDFNTHLTNDNIPDNTAIQLATDKFKHLAIAENPYTTGSGDSLVCIYMNDETNKVIARPLGHLNNL